MNFPDELKQIINAQTHPLVFVAVSGAHLYGFASADSDYDLRGVHVLSVRELAGLKEPDRTVEYMSDPTPDDPLEIDLVTHDLKKFIQMMLKRNGYVLEQLYSPLVLHTTAEHEQLKELGHGCITRHHVHHYLGFAQNQWKLFNKNEPQKIKPLLYLYRVLLTGIHLMQTGRIEASLLNLNTEYKLPYIDDLVEQKQSRGEHATLSEVDLGFHTSEYQKLEQRLQLEGEKTHLPDKPSSYDALDELLVNTRIKHTD